MYTFKAGRHDLYLHLNVAPLADEARAADARARSAADRLHARIGHRNDLHLAPVSEPALAAARSLMRRAAAHPGGSDEPAARRRAGAAGAWRAYSRSTAALAAGGIYGLPGSGSTSPASGQGTGPGEPKPYTDASVPASRVTMFGASPGEAPGRPGAWDCRTAPRRSSATPMGGWQPGPGAARLQRQAPEGLQARPAGSLQLPGPEPARRPDHPGRRRRAGRNDPGREKRRIRDSGAAGAQPRRILPGDPAAADHGRSRPEGRRTAVRHQPRSAGGRPGRRGRQGRRARRPRQRRRRPGHARPALGRQRMDERARSNCRPRAAGSSRCWRSVRAAPETHGCWRNCRRTTRPDRSPCSGARSAPKENRRSGSPSPQPKAQPQENRCRCR